MDKSLGEIKIESYKEGSYCVFSVKDNGAGIHKEDLTKIFEMFGKAHTNEKIDSSGIGLAIVKRIIEENKGKIWVESVAGQGSCFYFSIPLT